MDARDERQVEPFWQFCEREPDLSLKPGINWRSVFYGGLLMGAISGVSWLFWTRV